MALRSTQPPKDISTRNLAGGKGWLTHKADKLTANCESIVYKMWEPRRLTNLRPPRPLSRISLPLTFLHYTHKKYNWLKRSEVGDQQMISAVPIHLHRSGHPLSTEGCFRNMGVRHHTLK
jgi:hypothetical protein